MSDNFAGDGAEQDEMSRPRPISDATADVLLAGGVVDDPAIQDLAQVLAAASAPGSARELHREDSAAAAFAAAHLPHESPRHRRLTVRNLLGVKLAAATLAAMAVGGIALAASTGVLPDPLHPAPPSSRTPGPAVSTPDSAPRSPTATPTPTPAAEPLNSLRGLCVVYLNQGAAGEKNKHVAEDLAVAAGGIDKVEAYCIALVGPPKDKPSRGPKVRSSPV